jgi:hypothetical protein
MTNNLKVFWEHESVMEIVGGGHLSASIGHFSEKNIGRLSVKV